MGQLGVLGGALAIAAALTICGTAARAGPLPAATGFVGCSAVGGEIDNASMCTTTGDSGMRSLQPFGSLSGTAAFVPNVPAGVVGFLTYSFEVTGGTPGDIVPLDIDTLLQAVITGRGHALSEISVTTSLGSVNQTICSDLCGDVATSFSGALHISARSGLVDTLSLEIEASSGQGGAGSGATAFADPLIFVDPGFVGADQYDILLSDGVGNGVATSGAPEPASWAIQLAGFGGLGAAMRARRRAVALVA